MELNNGTYRALAIKLLEENTIVDDGCGDSPCMWNVLQSDDEYHINTISDCIKQFFDEKQQEEKA